MCPSTYTEPNTYSNKAHYARAVLIMLYMLDILCSSKLIICVSSMFLYFNYVFMAIYFLYLTLIFFLLSSVFGFQFIIIGHAEPNYAFLCLLCFFVDFEFNFLCMFF